MINKKQNEIEHEGCGIERMFFVAETSARCLAGYIAGVGLPECEHARARIAVRLVDNAEELWDELCKRFPAQDENEGEVVE
jgi:hypothetical protein